jgi:hypothetical protein
MNKYAVIYRGRKTGRLLSGRVSGPSAGAAVNSHPWASTPLAWFAGPDLPTGTLSELLAAALEDGRGILRGSDQWLVGAGQPDTVSDRPVAAHDTVTGKTLAAGPIHPADAAMLKRDGPAKPAAAAPTPPAPQAKPAPRGLALQFDVARHTHQINPAWATAAVRDAV